MHERGGVVHKTVRQPRRESHVPQSTRNPAYPVAVIHLTPCSERHPCSVERGMERRHTSVTTVDYTHTPTCTSVGGGTPYTDRRAPAPGALQKEKTANGSMCRPQVWASRGTPATIKKENAKIQCTKHSSRGTRTCTLRMRLTPRKRPPGTRPPPTASGRDRPGPPAPPRGRFNCHQIGSAGARPPR